VTITSFEKGSQLFIYTSELSDTGLYMVNLKNMVGQDTFAIEIRVTGNQISYLNLLYTGIQYCLND